MPALACQTSAGKATVTIRSSLVSHVNDFVVYPSHPPKQAADVILAPKTGLVVPQTLAMVANGAASMTQQFGQKQQLGTRPAGVGHMSPPDPTMHWSPKTTSNGRAGSAWYLATPIRLAATSRGKTTMTAYESGHLDLGAWTPHGVGHVTSYITGPVYAAATAHGIASVTIDPERQLQRWTAHGVSTATVLVSRVQPLVSTTHGVSVMTIEIQGVPLLRAAMAGAAGGFATLSDLRNYYGFKAYAGSYGSSSYSNSGFYGSSYYVDENKLGLNWQSRNFPSFSQTFGVKASLFQDVQFVSNGVAALVATLGRRAFISLTAHGVGQMNVIPPPQLAMRTKTNTDYLTQNGAYLYTPDRWLMNAIWALFNRSRGRSHVDITMFMRTVYGDLLHRYWSSQRPGDSDVDSGSRPSAGQYWPRQLKLPHREVPTPYPYWYEYEYVRK